MIEKKPPLKEFRHGRVFGTIWEQEWNTADGEKSVFLSTTLSKSFPDSSTGKWRRSNRYTHDELLDAKRVIDDVVEYIATWEANR